MDSAVHLVIKIFRRRVGSLKILFVEVENCQGDSFTQASMNTSSPVKGFSSRFRDSGDTCQEKKLSPTPGRGLGQKYAFETVQHSFDLTASPFKMDGELSAAGILKGSPTLGGIELPSSGISPIRGRVYRVRWYDVDDPPAFAISGGRSRSPTYHSHA